LIFLANLLDKAIDDLTASIGTSEDVPNVVFHNWLENQEPCSGAQMYQIFQTIKPPHHEEVYQIFVMFIDGDTSREKYHIIFADETFDSPRRRLRDESSIGLSRLSDTKDALRCWHAIWNPFSNNGPQRVRVNDAGVNVAIK
jgi:hypothetical protein